MFYTNWTKPTQPAPSADSWSDDDENMVSKAAPDEDFPEYLKNPLPTKENSAADRQVAATAENALQQVSLARQAVSETAPIAKNYTTETPIDEQRQAHKKAKDFLSLNLQRIGARVRFISPPEGTTIPKYQHVDISEPLDPKIFSWENTGGVMEDIFKDGERTNPNVKIVYGVASQFNGCEAPDRYTVPPGEAVDTYRGDRTQGPQAQLAFGDLQVEIINAAGNIGYNALVYMLDEETRSAVQHGYFTPSPANIDRIINLLETKDHLIEYPCIENKPYQKNAPVHAILIAAPAFGSYGGWNLTEEQKNTAQFLTALLGFRAQFRPEAELLKECEQLIFKPAAVGLGVFGNNPKIVALAYYVAAKELQNRLPKNADVQVRFQVFRGSGAAREMADHLKLPQFGG